MAINPIRSIFFYLMLISINVTNPTHNIITVFARIADWAENDKFGGHPGVTRSIIEGLNKINVAVNYNPLLVAEVAPVVLVLADVDVLEEMIRLKRMGFIKKLLAGPNLMIRSMEHNAILACPEIDAIITPCEWVKIAYEQDLPALKGRIYCWYAGIDTYYWQPSVESVQKNKNMLIYHKSTSEEFTQKVELLVRIYGWNPVRITYGQYTPEQYKNLLDQCTCAIFLSISESQGLALGEAWSMNVPTLVWNQKQLQAHGRTYEIASSCPYLTDATGKDWKELHELAKLLSTLDNDLITFTPRSWVINNMSDQQSARLMIKIVESLP